MTNPSDERPIKPSRRRFLIAASATALAPEIAGLASAQSPAQVSGTQDAPAPQGPASQPELTPSAGLEGYQFLTQPDVEALTAMVNRLIPADEFGPGGVEAGVVTFIDRQLGGQFGAAARWYMQGPWAEGSPSQGWQLALTPAEIYRTGFRSLDRWCLGSKGKRFAELAANDQDEVLTLLQSGKIELNGIPSASFFQILWQNTVEGYLGDPLYGGNRDMAAWRMIHFPGSNPVLTPAVDLNGELYETDPISIGP
ncbi:gluconate 2-dehydrogenase subunit 3 family protein [Microvirga sp. M2]|uniref:gluconate 2-dehydrogenase subunit 3 family protein n=1 Tax=Microvirga sp. M2 TaxID=3073270 RepID=UPI0039C19812